MDKKRERGRYCRGGRFNSRGRFQQVDQTIRINFEVPHEHKETIQTTISRTQMIVDKTTKRKNQVMSHAKSVEELIIWQLSIIIGMTMLMMNKKHKKHLLPFLLKRGLMIQTFNCFRSYNT